MAINVVRYDDDGTPRWGVIHNDAVQTLSVDATSTATLMSEGPAKSRFSNASISHFMTFCIASGAVLPRAR